MENSLMKARYIQSGDAVDITPAQNLAAGEIVQLGPLVGITRIPVPAGTTGSIALTGIFEFMKNPDTVIKAGANVYWDEEHSRADSRGSILLGIAIAPAPGGRNSTLVLLNCSKHGMSGYVSAESGNLAELKDDGVFVPPLEWQTIE